AQLHSQIAGDGDCGSAGWAMDAAHAGAVHSRHHCRLACGDQVTTAQLAALMSSLGGMLWALGRVGGFCMVAPVFSATVIPMRVRGAIAVLLTFVLAPLAPAQQLDLFSAAGVATMVVQVLIGGSVGFVLQLVFQ